MQAREALALVAAVLLSQTPVSAFVAVAPAQCRSLQHCRPSLAWHGLTGSLRVPALGLPTTSRRRRATSRVPRSETTLMCGGCSVHGVITAAAAIGAALPDTPLTTNLGVPAAGAVCQALFMASNAGYFLAGAATLRTRDSPKLALGVGLLLIGVASCLFHYFQCVMPVGSPVTTAFCALDSVIACSLFPLFGTLCWPAIRMPSARTVIGWPLAFLLFCHAGALYTWTHAAWHLLTAYLAYALVEDRDAQMLRPSARTRAPVPWPAAARTIFGRPGRAVNACQSNVLLWLIASSLPIFSITPDSSNPETQNPPLGARSKSARNQASRLKTGSLVPACMIICIDME